MRGIVCRIKIERNSARNTGPCFHEEFNEKLIENSQSLALGGLAFLIDRPVLDGLLMLTACVTIAKPCQRRSTGQRGGLGSRCVIHKDLHQWIMTECLRIVT